MNYKEKWGHKVKLTNKYCPITGLKASGLPPTTVIACNMDKLEDRMSKLEKVVDSNPLKTCELLLSKIDNVQGISICNRELINSALDARINPIMNELLLLRNQNLNQASASISESSNNSDEFRVFCWGGQFHFIPEDYVLPHCAPKRLWILWIYGD